MRARSFVFAVLGALVGIPAAIVATVAATYLLHNEISGVIAYGDEERQFLLHVPPALVRDEPVPLVLSLHGAMGWPALQRDITGWNRLADEKGFIVAYAGGRGTGPKAWFMHGADDPTTMPDVRFVADLLDRLQTQYRIDPTRIYVEGLSNGGGMAFVLACTMPSRVAAAGLVASAQSLPPTWCRQREPVPMIAVHGSADTIVPYAGGNSPIAPRPFPAVEHWVAHWARLNGCAARSMKQPVAADVARTAYDSCGQGASVELYTVQGGGHQWPGGRLLPEWLLGRKTNSIDATRLLWAFFERHPMGERAAVRMGM